MADNLTIKDGALDTRILRATDTAGVHTPHHVIEFDGGAVTALNPLPVAMSSDIQIGAVEIKDATTDTRAVVGASGLYVDVQALPALPAGTNNIGDVDVLSLPELPAGTNKIGGVDIVTIPALVAGSAIIGQVGIDQTTPGTTNGVQVLASALPTDAATQTTLAALDGKVTACNTGAVVLAAGSAAIGTLAANSGVDIGDVDVLTLPALVAGSANIGNVGLPGAVLELSASSAKTESASGTAVACGQYRRFAVLLDVTALATDAGDTLDVFIDFSPDGGTTYVNAAHFTQQVGTGSAAKLWAVIDSANPGTSVVDVTADAVAGAVRPALFGGHIRARWAIVDDSTDDASFTFAVTAYAQ